MQIVDDCGIESLSFHVRADILVVTALLKVSNGSNCWWLGLQIIRDLTGQARRL